MGNNGPVLLEDVNFVEKMAHLTENVYLRGVVHAKGTGAFGYFQPYQSMSDYTCASFLQNPSKKRKFSSAFLRSLAFAALGYGQRSQRLCRPVSTDEGNYDVVGLSFPVFFIRDLISFPDFIHSQKPDPQSNIQNFERIWDFYSLMPECAHLLTWLYSDRGNCEGLPENGWFWRKYFCMGKQTGET